MYIQILVISVDTSSHKMRTVDDNFFRNVVLIRTVSDNYLEGMMLLRHKMMHIPILRLRAVLENLKKF